MGPLYWLISACVPLQLPPSPNYFEEWWQWIYKLIVNNHFTQEITFADIVLVHRLPNLYQLKLSSCVKFALFNTSTGRPLRSQLKANSKFDYHSINIIGISPNKLSNCRVLYFFYFSDVTRGSSLFENIFVSGGALLTDDVILKTINIGNYSVARSCDFQNLAETHPQAPNGHTSWVRRQAGFRQVVLPKPKCTLAFRSRFQPSYENRRRFRGKII